MTRRKPMSNKQRKAELQLKRAIKRGDVEAPPPKAKERDSKRRIHGIRVGNAANLPSQSTGIGTRKLESRFMKLSKEWLEHAKLVASTTSLERPVPFKLAVLDTNSFNEVPVVTGSTETTSENASDTGSASNRARSSGGLVAPRRPKWRYDQTKKEVEKNEEGLFSKWLQETDQIVDHWRKAVTPEPSPTDQGDQNGAFERSPTYFERNLEVWRQLWRVTEISQILMVLLDCRAPTLHFPKSLQQYLQALRPPRELVLVLTKVDLVDKERVTSWTNYLSAQNPGARIVQVESYRDRQVLTDGHGKKRFVEPHIPEDSLHRLVDALKSAHDNLLKPPKAIENDSEKIKQWKPKVKEKITWDAIWNKDGVKMQPPPSANPDATEDNTNQEDSEFDQRFLTIGLIGQPNVGKSSLLNALFGTSKVRASRTPGKTKHFQTLFWSPEIRLVDCPGLVFPALVPMELQVMAGVLPISQIASIPSCVQFVGERMPIENILRLEHPNTIDTPAEDKRTWRQGMERDSGSSARTTWTAMDVLTAFALNKGWRTAKAGRPDVNRAGNAILRACADGRNVKWAYWAPEGSASDIQMGHGIWIEDENEWEDGDDDENDNDNDDEDDRGGSGHMSSSTRSDAMTDENSDQDEEQDTFASPIRLDAGGRFGALALDDDGGSSTTDESI